MALNWQFTDRKRFGKISNPKANNTFIWGCLLVGLMEINEKNAEEWRDRYHFYDALCGPFYYRRKKPYRPTLAEVKERIGLRTNVSHETGTQFRAKVYRAFAEQLKRDDNKGANA